MKLKKYISLIILMVLLCGCSKTDNMEAQQLKVDEESAAQQLDVSQIEDTRFPDQMLELSDSQLNQQDMEELISYDTEGIDYQILERIQAFGYTAKDFAYSVEDVHLFIRIYARKESHGLIKKSLSLQEILALNYKI